MLLPSTSKLFCGVYISFAILAVQPFIVEQIAFKGDYILIPWWVAYWMLPAVMSWISWKAGESRGACGVALGGSIAGLVLYWLSFWMSPTSPLYDGWDGLVYVPVTLFCSLAGLAICLLSTISSASALFKDPRRSPIGLPTAPVGQDGYPITPTPSQYSTLPVDIGIPARKGFLATVWKPFAITLALAMVVPAFTALSCQAQNFVQNEGEKAQAKAKWEASNPEEVQRLEARGLEPYVYFYTGNSTPYLRSEWNPDIGAVSWTYKFDSSGRMSAYAGDFSGLKFAERGNGDWDGKSFSGQVVFVLDEVNADVISGLDRDDMEALTELPAGRYGTKDLEAYLD